MFHATIFGNVTALIQRLYGVRKSVQDAKWRNLKDFTILHSLPKHLKRRMEDYFQTMWSLNHGIDPVEVSLVAKNAMLVKKLLVYQTSSAVLLDAIS